MLTGIILRMCKSRLFGFVMIERPVLIRMKKSTELLLPQEALVTTTSV